MYPEYETLEDGKQIQYTYDKAHNIILKEVFENNVIKESYNYTYDSLNRLIEEKCLINNDFDYHIKYNYSEDGDILEKINIGSNGVPLTKQKYIYSSTIKNQLNSIENYFYENNEWEYDDAYTICTYSTDPFRPSSYRNNNLTWQGRRLLSYGNNTYTYNSEGIRISKTTPSGTYNYILEDNKIIKEIKPNNINVYYHYDEKGLLVGFNYNNNEYFYVRDILGNIINIIDSNGNIQATYRYNAYGKRNLEEILKDM